eukprot:7569212-Pyramimonas_sp.AAC.1
MFAGSGSDHRTHGVAILFISAETNAHVSSRPSLQDSHRPQSIQGKTRLQVISYRHIPRTQYTQTTAPSSCTTPPALYSASPAPDACAQSGVPT